MIIQIKWENKTIRFQEKKILLRGHSDLNQGPIDLQSIALPLSYTPFHENAADKDEQ